jgi:hypothetical protein
MARFRILRTACALVSSLIAAPVLAGPIPGQGTWQSTLQARDLTGDNVADAFYDTVLDVTWLADANANLANANQVPNVYAGGNLTWSAAMSWAGNLTLGGYTEWRLPKMLDTGTAGCNFSFAGGTDCGHNSLTKSGATVYSELSHLFHETLGNVGKYTTSGAVRPGVMGIDYGLLNSGNFSNFEDLITPTLATYYWFGQEYAPNTVYAWAFVPADGGQFMFSKVDLSGQRLAIAVHEGDIGVAVTAVPEPETYAMLLAGLGLVGLARRRRNCAG